MKRIALTGGIATGKSYVLECFRRQGVPCLDADALAHGAMGPGTEVTAAIQARFGSDVIDPGGSVNRRKLGPIVFADAAARRDLEAIVHPAVYRAIEAGTLAFARTGDAPFLVIDIPLLFETGRAASFDAVIVTAASPEVQLDRLRARGLSDEDARRRLAAQLPTEEKAARADFVIRTEGSFEETDAQVGDVIQALRRRE